MIVSVYFIAKSAVYVDEPIFIRCIVYDENSKYSRQYIRTYYSNSYFEMLN